MPMSGFGLGWHLPQTQAPQPYSLGGRHHQLSVPQLWQGWVGFGMELVVVISPVSPLVAISIGRDNGVTYTYLLWLAQGGVQVPVVLCSLR